MKKFRNTYRIESGRDPNCNYASCSAYFIAICTHNKIPFFGKIINGKSDLSEIGQIVFDEWLKIVEIRNNMNITLDSFLVMPDHFHVIIRIGKNEFNENKLIFVLNTSDKQGMQSNNLSSIVRGFISAGTMHARNIDSNFKWQTRFHDRIIRDENEFERIKKYIDENPVKWAIKNIGSPIFTQNPCPLTPKNKSIQNPNKSIRIPFSDPNNYLCKNFLNENL